MQSSEGQGTSGVRVVATAHVSGNPWMCMRWMCQELDRTSTSNAMREVMGLVVIIVQAVRLAP